MINTQTPEKKSISQTLEICGKPWLTIQGEGPFAGVPAVFVRFAGCNLQCPGCDTDYTSDRRQINVDDLVVEIGPRSGRLVVLSGGEPMRQSLSDLVNALIAKGCLVQIETNGTFYQLLPFGHACLSVICSPKTAQINHQLVRHINAFKYVVQHGHIDPIDGLPLRVLGADCRVYRAPHNAYNQEIFVQPLDEQDELRNKLNTETAIRVCQKHDYRLSLQLHKILGLK